MYPIPDGLKLALYWFVDAISKGLLDNENWDMNRCRSLRPDCLIGIATWLR